MFQTAIPNTINDMESMIILDTSRCLSRKNKTNGIQLQCPFKKKNGDYCGKHSNPKNWCLSVYENIDTNFNENNKNNKNKKLTCVNNIIIDIQDYNNNKKLNYNVSCLKTTLKHYKLKINGKKEDLVSRLQSHFDSLVPFIQEQEKIRLLQVKIKYFLNMRNIILRGKAIYQRHLCNNAEDFYSFEPVEEIPFNSFFSYQDTDNFIYGFDIKSFHKLIELKQNNPYNRKLIPTKAINNLNKLLEINKSKNLLQEDICEVITNQQKFHHKVVNIFHHMEILTGTVNTSWFTQLNIYNLKKFYKFLEDIWNYRAELTLTQKIKIIKDKVLFPVSVHNFYKIHNMNKLKSIIIHEIEKLIFTADDVADQTLACYYVLTAFCDVSEEARISFPWLVQV